MISPSRLFVLAVAFGITAPAQRTENTTLVYQKSFPYPQDVHYPQQIVAIAAGPGGSVYIAGNTGISPSIQPTPGAAQTVWGDTGNPDCYFTMQHDNPDCGDAFVIKLGPDGNVVYTTFLGGKGKDFASGIAVDAEGDAYVIGQTQSASFPVTHGAAETTLVGPGAAFVAKLSPNGDRLVYATYLSNGGGGIAVSSAGEAYVSPFSSTGLISRISADGSKVLASRTAVVTTIAVDSTGDLYSVSGSSVVKYTPDLAQVTWSVDTGARPGHLKVDGAGNVYAAGTAQASDTVRTTPGALQPNRGGDTDAFVVKLAPDGTVLFATYFGSSQGEGVFGLGVDAASNVFITGPASPYVNKAKQFLPFAGRPVRDCESIDGGVSFLAKLSSDGRALLFSTPLEIGSALDVDAQGNAYVFGSWGSFRPLYYLDKISSAPGDARPQPACVVNSASFSPRVLQYGPGTVPGLGPVAAGELITILGSPLGPTTPASGTWDANGRLPTTLGGVRVLFDSTPAPLLYVADRQINAIVPFDVAGKEAVNMVVERDGLASDQRVLNVIAAAPGVFTMPNLDWQLAALNEDGTLNSEQHPAKAGSILAVWATGLGMLDPVPVDGAMNALPLARLASNVQLNNSNLEVVYAGPAPGLVAGTMQINFRAPPPKQISKKLSWGLDIQVTLPSGRTVQANLEGGSFWVEP